MAANTRKGGRIYINPVPAAILYIQPVRLQSSTRKCTGMQTTITGVSPQIYMYTINLEYQPACNTPGVAVADRLNQLAIADGHLTVISIGDYDSGQNMAVPVRQKQTVSSLNGHGQFLTVGALRGREKLS